MAANCGIAILDMHYTMPTTPDTFIIWNQELVLIVEEKVNFTDACSVNVKLHLKYDVLNKVRLRRNLSNDAYTYSISMTYKCRPNGAVFNTC